MRKVFMAAALAAALGSYAVVSEKAAKAATVKDISWMQGSWEANVWGGTFEEHWTSAKAGTMLGVGRHMEGAKTGFMEFASIEATKDGLTMFMMLGAPSKGSKTPVPFVLTKLNGKEAVWENPKNDFPSKIIYKMRADGNLFCKIEGVEKGKPSSQDFDFKKIK
jgi:hypothetical protein